MNGHRINKCVLKAGDKISFARIDMEYRVDNINYQEKNVSSLPTSSNNIKSEESKNNMLGTSKAAVPA